MRIHDPREGRTYYRKTRVRIEEPGHAREFTFSCYKGFKFFKSDLTRGWFAEHLNLARGKFGFDLWAYVIMPEHAHVLVHPGAGRADTVLALAKVKECVARRAIKHIELNAPEWIERITVREGARVRRRFWQPGGGYDRNVTQPSTLGFMIDYIHMNPVRRGLVDKPEDWLWSSAKWYAGLHPAVLEMDKTLHSSIQIGSVGNTR